MAGIYGMPVSALAMEYSKKVIDNRDNSKSRWAIYQYMNDTVGIARYGGDTGWETLLHYLDKIHNETAYVVVNFVNNKPKDKLCRSKRIMIMWAPDGAKTREKFMTAMHVRDVRDTLTGGSCTIMIQANDISDLKYETVRDRISSKTCMR